MLADSIAIIYEGSLVTTGSATSLKASYGKGYEIHQLPEGEHHVGDAVLPVWHMKTSSEATKKLLELEELSGGLYSVTFPSLDQAFLHLTNSSLHSGVNSRDSTTSEAIVRQETEQQALHVDASETSTLENGRRVGFFAQVTKLSKSHL